MKSIARKATTGQVPAHRSTPEQMAKDIKVFGKQMQSDPQKARAFLQRAGILTETGKLAKSYR